MMPNIHVAFKGLNVIIQSMDTSLRINDPI